MKTALKELLDALDQVCEQHEELGDTDVRERMAEAIEKAFALKEPGYRLPRRFGMFSRQGDAKVRAALVAFLMHPEVALATRTLETPEARLAAFQDGTVTSSRGSTFDTYFGYTRNLNAKKHRPAPEPILLKVLKKSRHRPREGDIFVMLPPDGLYLYGRVISTAVSSGFRGVPCVLIYIYRPRSKTKLPVPDLSPQELLVPPIITGTEHWREGYFEVVENRPLRPADQLAQHCFRDSEGRYWDEKYNRLPHPIEPVGEAGLTLILGIDKATSKALGIPRPEVAMTRQP